MNQQRNNMYAPTSACSVNVASTSTLPPHAHQQQQHSGGTLPTNATPTMYYMSADPYAQQQIIQYGDSTFAPQENIYQSKDMFTSPTNTFTARLPNYSYSALPPGQNDFTSIQQQQQYANQPPQSLANQSNNPTATPQLLQQSHQPQTQQQQQQFNAVMMQQPPPQTYRKQQTYQMNFQNNSVPAPAFNNATAPIHAQANHSQQKLHNMHQQNNGNNSNGNDQQRSSRISTMFDSTADNYTASWVSSTSSIPPDQKLPPDHNSPTTGSFDFTSWENTIPPKMSTTDSTQQQQAKNIPSVGPTGSYPVQQQPTQIYAGQATPIQQMQYYNPSQHQFAGDYSMNSFAAANMGYYSVPPPYLAYPTPFVFPNYPAFPQYIPLPLNHVLWPSEAKPLYDQNERFKNSWLDQTRSSQQESDIQNAVLQYAYDHNARIGNGEMNNGPRGALLLAVAGDSNRGNGTSYTNSRPFKQNQKYDNKPSNGPPSSVNWKKR